MFKRPVIEFTTTPPQTVDIPGWSLILLFLAYILPGNIGHAPWRGDDVLHIAAAANMVRSGDWLVPRIGGLAFLDSPPLHYWLGGLTGTLLGWLLPLHDAIRLASVAALAFGLWALREAAGRLVPAKDCKNGTLLIALSSMGLLIHSHEAQPMITLFACVAGSLWGLSMLDGKPRRGLLIAGGFVGAAFLAGGLPGLVLTLPACVVALLAGKAETRPSIWHILAGVVLAVVLIALWPVLLAWRNPNLLTQWWQQEVFDIAPTVSWQRLSALSGLLSWFAWPLWPIAGWTLWQRRRQLASLPYAVPLAALLSALWIIITTGTVRPANVLPLLPPLILLAGPEVSRLRKGASNLLDWFGIMTFTLLGAFLWLSWTALHLGWPFALARNVSRLTPDFAPHIGLWATPIAALLSVGWFIALRVLPRFPLRGVLRWALGVTLAWGLATTLWLDWFDYDKNYARIVAQIAEQVNGSKSPCVMEIGAGDVQRAALDYFSSIRLQRFSKSNTRCDLLLSYRAGRNALAQPGEGWTLQWNQSKGRGRLQEQFALFRRN
ncbi:MAG: hypothetical protein JWN23_1469 [Rhodocyclales bacterium]|nr:hypothetical protein [Rhodocyclales bacterium]